ncbi:hypothetical protein [Streptomyces sp. NPDC086787]|uniref:hypothetical protein n=1 Tax=Streptomyces sp. NPDC086787 TaxID=3365759 RepID=UPI0038179CB3
MNRTRLAALSFLVAPALALGPSAAAGAAPAAPAAPDAPSVAACHVETESNGRFHLWGEGFPGGAKVTYSGSSHGTVHASKSGRFDLGGLSGHKWVVKSGNGKKLTCVMAHHR